MGTRGRLERLEQRVGSKMPTEKKTARQMTDAELAAIIERALPPGFKPVAEWTDDDFTAFIERSAAERTSNS